MFFHSKAGLEPDVFVGWLHNIAFIEKIVKKNCPRIRKLAILRNKTRAFLGGTFSPIPL